MTRNHLLILSMQPSRSPRRSVWRMTMDVIGATFGVPVRRDIRR